MPDMIRDGTGHGYLTKVDGNNRIWAFCSSLDNSFFMNFYKQNAFTMSISNVTAASVNGCIGYIKNTDSENDLVVVRVRHRCNTTNTVLTIKLNDTGTPAGTTVVSPVNRNAKSTKTAIGEFYSGTNITGLSGGSGVASIFSIASQPWEEFAPCSNLILGVNNIMTFYVDNNTAANWVGIGFYYKESE